MRPFAFLITKQDCLTLVLLELNALLRHKTTLDRTMTAAAVERGKNGYSRLSLYLMAKKKVIAQIFVT